MKIRDSGMPEQAQWESYFNPETVLRALKFPAEGDAVDFGCGYGTFAIAAARLTAGTVHAFDIETDMIAVTALRARSAGLPNVRPVARDFMTLGTDLTAASAEYAMVFNVLHTEEPVRLLAEAFRVLRPGGVLAMLHWVQDATTPRGPALAIRPTPRQCAEWASQVGFLCGPSSIPLPPHHFGLAATKPAG